MKLHFLGTGAGLPARERNVTAIGLQLPAGGTWWLFDCGEATQHQLLHSPLRLSRLTHIFITHMHGDHVYGLPGLLSSRSFQAPDVPVTITGPVGIRQFVAEICSLSHTHLSYPLTIHELQPGTEPPEMTCDGMTVTADWLNHVIPSLGYRIAEPNRSGSLNVELLTELGLPPGPLYGRLKQREPVMTPDGRIIEPDMVISPPTAGRVICLLGDTAPCLAADRLANHSDWLVHEATFASAEQAKAHQYGHSTSADAAQCARAASVTRLLLTHISTRYQGESLNTLRDEARAIFPAADIAADGDVYTMP